MQSLAVCPDVSRWQQALRGELDEAQAEPMLEHLAGCECCGRLVRGLPKEDTLEEALRDRTVADVPEAVHRLMERLKGLPLVRNASGTDQTAASDSLASSVAVPVGEATEENYDFLGPAEGPDEIGRLGGYRVRKLLGSGGMGAVFLATDPHLGRDVALKVIKPGGAASAAARGRFLREARACASLTHDNIVTIYQVGEDRGVPFLAMEFLQGMSLDGLLNKGRRLSPAQVLRIGRDVARGLAAAHEKGLIHRDIKPANVWLDKTSGRVKVLDFGLARSESEDVQLTQSGAIVGTPAFMAPEQARSERVDGRSDLFSLGCLLYRLCAGENAFAGQNTMAVLLALALNEPVPVRQRNPAVPEALAELIGRLMAKDPAKRPASAREVVAEIQAIEKSLAASSAALAAPREEPTESLPVPVPVVPSPRPAPKRGRVGWLVAAAVLALLVGGGLFGAVVFSLRTDKGTLVVEIDDPDVEVRVRQNGIVVDDGKKRTFKLEVGEGELEVTDKDGTKLTTKKFAIKRNDKTIVTVTLQEVAKATDERPLAKGASPFDSLRRKDIPKEELEAFGNGDADAAPKELVAVLGSSRFTTSDTVYSLAYRPDGKQLAAISSSYPNYRLHLLDATTGRRQTGWSADAVGISVAYSPDGKLLAIGQGPRGDNEIRLMDAETGKIAQKLRGHTREVNFMIFSADGKRLVSGSGNHNATQTAPGEVIAWDLETGKAEWTVPIEKHGISAMALSKDGKRVAGASNLWGGAVVLWDAANGKEVRKIDDPKRVGTADAPRGLAFHPDGKSLVAGARNCMRVIEMESGKVTSETQVNHMSVAYSPDGKLLAIGEQLGKVTLMDTANSRATELVGPASDCYRLAFSPDGKTLACCHLCGGVVLWDVAKGQRVFPDESHVGPAYGIAVSGDGRWVVSAGRDNTVRVWDASTAKQLRSSSHPHTINGVSISPDGKLVAAVGAGLNVWDRASGRERFADASLQHSSSVAYSPDGTRLLVASGQAGGVVVLDAASGAEVRTWKTNVQYGRVAWSKDGKYCSHGSVGSVGLLELGSGKEPIAFEQGASNGVAFSPDGRFLLAATNAGLERWDLKTMKKVERLGEAFYGPRYPAYSPDGKWLACDKGQRIEVLDANTGKPAWSISVGKGVEVTGLAWAPDSRHLIAGNTLGTTAVFRMEQ